VIHEAYCVWQGEIVWRVLLEPRCLHTSKKADTTDRENYVHCEGTIGRIKYKKLRVKKGKCFDGLIDIYKEFFRNDDKKNNKKWIFRGQKRKRTKEGDIDCSHCDKTSCEKDNVAFLASLQKAFSKFMIAGPGETQEEAKQKWEKDVIRAFKRKAHHYESNIPDKVDILEWLALIQHYFGPTRLLDWVYSYFIACYFAMNELDCKEEIAEVWAIDANWLTYNKERKVERIAEIIGNGNYSVLNTTAGWQAEVEHIDRNCALSNGVIHFLMREPSACVYNVTPFRLNERLINQQGTFLLQGDITQCFIRNLEATLRDNLTSSSEHLMRVVISLDGIEAKKQVLRDLDRMGINQAMLFPDLRGFAESLIRRLAFPEKRNPK